MTLGTTNSPNTIRQSLEPQRNLTDYVMKDSSADINFTKCFGETHDAINGAYQPTEEFFIENSQDREPINFKHYVQEVQCLD